MQTQPAEPLTPDRIDFAIEQAELLEISFEQQGRHIQAVYTAHLKKKLIAMRDKGDQQ